MRYVVARAAVVMAAFTLVFTLAMSNVGQAAAANLSHAAGGTSSDGAAGWSLLRIDPGVSSGMWPGSAPVELQNEVINRSSQPETLSGVGAAVNSSQGDAIDESTGLPIAGCSADWFAVQTSVTINDGAKWLSLPVQVAPGQAVTANVAVSIVESGTRQDACRGRDIRVTTSAN
ncbi:MAG: hypothetical protein JO148_05635 [Acidimicrobiia bacterium]|nr:hypothetical protein [Acidimicrobiia bacterium]